MSINEIDSYFRHENSVSVDLDLSKILIERQLRKTISIDSHIINRIPNSFLISRINQRELKPVFNCQVTELLRLDQGPINSIIYGIGDYKSNIDLARERTTNENLIQKIDETIYKKTGIKGRFHQRIENDYSPQDLFPLLTFNIISDLLQMKGWEINSDEISIFLMSTFPLDHWSRIVSSVLNIDDDRVWGIYVGSSSLTQAFKKIFNQKMEKIIIVSLDFMHYAVHKDEAISHNPNCFLFGDLAVGMAIDLNEGKFMINKIIELEKKNPSLLLRTTHFLNKSESKIITEDEGENVIGINNDEPEDETVDFAMDRESVIKLCLTEIPKLLTDFVPPNRRDDFNFIILHQANRPLINLPLSNQLMDIGFHGEIPWVSTYVGNTSACTTPAALVSFVKHCLDNQSNKSLKGIICGFGAGFAASAAEVDINLSR